MGLAKKFLCLCCETVGCKTLELVTFVRTRFGSMRAVLHRFIELWLVRCRQEILRICELMKLRIFDTEMNRIQSRIYYNPANVCIMPENIEINISEIDS